MLSVELVTYSPTTSKKQVVQTVKLHVCIFIVFASRKRSTTQHSTLNTQHLRSKTALDKVINNKNIYIAIVTSVRVLVKEKYQNVLTHQNKNT